MSRKMLDTPRQLRLRIARLERPTPVTAAFEDALRRRGAGPLRPWYRTQKQHWLGWLDGYDGPGAYGRQCWDRPPRFVFNHICCPPMLLWLVEASGVPEGAVARAARGALAGGTYPAMCGAIRAKVAWDEVERALLIGS